MLLRRAYLDPKETEREVSSDIKSPFAGHDTRDHDPSSDPYGRSR